MLPMRYLPLSDCIITHSAGIRNGLCDFRPANPSGRRLRTDQGSGSRGKRRRRQHKQCRFPAFRCRRDAARRRSHPRGKRPERSLQEPANRSAKPDMLHGTHLLPGEQQGITEINPVRRFWADCAARPQGAADSGVPRPCRHFMHRYRQRTPAFAGVLCMGVILIPGREISGTVVQLNPKLCCKACAPSVPCCGT